jgi:hypothetical protein
MAEDTVSGPVSNRYDRMEVAGAFGDLGTLVPFVVAYIGVLKMDPFGVLLAFGVPGVRTRGLLRPTLEARLHPRTPIVRG